MSRRRAAVKRTIDPDPEFHSIMLAKFINMLMWKGKKSVAETIVYHALEEVAKRKKKLPLDVFDSVIEILEPVVEVKSRRVGGATYTVPVDIRKERRTALAMRWLIDAARKRSGKGMKQSLVEELQDAMEEKGAAFKKKQDIYRMAEASRAFSHFRF